MKEAAGEANMTVVTIILIAVVVAVVTPIITSMLGNTAKRTCCMDSGGYWANGACQDAGASYDQCVSDAASRNSTSN